MKAFQMTLQQYQEIVTPLLQKLVKFGKKNKQYYYPGDYNQIILVDFVEATRINCSAAWMKLDMATQIEWMERNWEEKNGVTAVKEIPASIQAEYATIISDLLEVMPQGKVVLVDTYYPNTVKKDEIKSNKRIVKDAIEDGTYATLIMDGVMSEAQVEEVLASVNVRMPKSLDEKIKEFKLRVAFKQNPAMNSFMNQIMDSFQAEREMYHALYTKVYTKQVERFLEAVNESNNGTSEREAAKKLIGNAITANYQRLFMYAKNGNTIIRTERFDEEFAKMVNYVMEKLGEDLVYTLATKVQMILSELVSVEKLELYVKDMGLEGSFKFTLTNGSFVINTQAILAQGEVNIAHFRYLAHYKEVVKDGKELGTLNFEQMTKTFGEIK